MRESQDITSEIQSEESKASYNINGLTETVLLIIDDYFEYFNKEYIKSTIDKWSSDPEESESEQREGKKMAAEFLYKCINYNREDALIFLTRYYSMEDLENEECPESSFNILSKHCNGKIGDEATIFVHCRRLSNLPDEQLKKQIGKVIKEKSNDYLKELCPNLYKQMQREHNQSRQDIITL